MNPNVKDYFQKLSQWKAELTLLRSIALTLDLQEEYKWMHPCYTHEGKNVVLLQDFKKYCALLFPKGALLKNPHGMLIAITEKTQSARQIRFTDIDSIHRQEDRIRSTIQEAIAIELSGKQVQRKETSEFPIPEELRQYFADTPGLETAFHELTPGRQRGYLLHFADAKQTKTRLARIESCEPRILAGKGLQDCICGHSKRLPNCDGSHKRLSLTK